MKTTYIYCLKNPLSNEIKYIGKSNDPTRRLNQHIKEARNNKTQKDKWINSLLSRGLSPVIEVIEEVPISKWESAERAWIKNLKKEGIQLLNKAPGGVYIPRKKRRRRNKI